MTNEQNIFSIKVMLIRLCNKMLKLQIIYWASETQSGPHIFSLAHTKSPFPRTFCIFCMQRATNESLYYSELKKTNALRKF